MNEEGKVSVKSVRVHETDTGYAESGKDDLNLLPASISFDDFLFSPSIVDEWKTKHIFNNIKYGIKFSLKEPVQQIK